MLSRVTHKTKSLLGGTRGRRGETLTEVLVSVAIGGLALLMLAMAISASTNIALKSEQSMNDYYIANNEIVTDATTKAKLLSDETPEDFLKLNSGNVALVGDSASTGIVVKVFTSDHFDEDAKTPVVVFSKKPSS